jgi:hypothetical protein
MTPARRRGFKFEHELETQMPLRRAALLVALAVAGWAICGAAIGFAVMGKTALLVHAVVAALPSRF